MVGAYYNDDSLAGLGGADHLAGSGGDDTYIYSRGDGNDVIDEAGTWLGSSDRLVLRNVAPAAVTVRAVGELVALLTIAESAPGAGDNGSIHVLGGMGGSERGIESVVFDDGTVWSLATMQAMVVASQATAGDDDIFGLSGNDALEGGHGNDRLVGNGGSDRYIWRRGDGSDVIDETNDQFGVDRLVVAGLTAADISVMSEGTDAVIFIAESAPGAADGGMIRILATLNPSYQFGLETIEFGDGFDWTMHNVQARLAAIASRVTAGDDVINGFSTADTIEAGHGNDTLNGSNGNDTYIWSRGDGNDVIDKSNNQFGSDRLVLAGLSVADISVMSDGADAVITVAESVPGAADGGVIRLTGSLNPSYDFGTETVEFGDGIVWTMDDVRRAAIAARTSAGDDIIVGFSTAETFEGGQGDDTINGSTGDDTYIWRRGDGNDLIEEGGNQFGTDRLVLAGVMPADVSIRTDGGNHSNDVVVVIAESAPGANDGGVIRLTGSLNISYKFGVESVGFDDGTTWSISDYQSIAISHVQTDGDDVITGFNSNDTLSGGLGDDHLYGGDGSDTYTFGRGDGRDVVEDNGNGDTDTVHIRGYQPAELILSESNYAGRIASVIRFRRH